MEDADAILARIRETERCMVQELVSQVQKPSAGVPEPGIVMYGRTDITEGYWRLLSDCQYDLEEGLSLLQEAYKWQLKVRPKMKALIPKVYSQKPGLFSLRQIGFDSDGRPILYHCFAQDQAMDSDWTVDGMLTHAVHIVDNAGRSSQHKAGEERGMTVKLIIDCSGFTAVPFKSYENITKLHRTLMLLYPNVIENVTIVNFTPEVRIIWSSIADLLDDSLSSKVKFILMKDLNERIEPVPSEVLVWLQHEIRDNGLPSLSAVQKNFWRAPSKGPHDPRGTGKFVADFISGKQAPHGYENHPGIVYGS